MEQKQWGKRTICPFKPLLSVCWELQKQMRGGEVLPSHSAVFRLPCAASLNFKWTADSLKNSWTVREQTLHPDQQFGALLCSPWLVVLYKGTQQNWVHEEKIFCLPSFGISCSPVQLVCKETAFSPFVPILNYKYLHIYSSGIFKMKLLQWCSLPAFKQQ